MSSLADELIRQVTINCAERGLLLLRVRDEIRMTIAAYQTLYESSVAFGMRKALQAEQGKADTERKASQHATTMTLSSSLFAYSFPDVAALTDLPYISRSSAVRPTLQTFAAIQSSTSFSQDLLGLPLFRCPFTFPSTIVSFKRIQLEMCFL